jgi:hypothetical protein
MDSVQQVRGLVASRSDGAANAMRAPQPPPPPALPGTNGWLMLAVTWLALGCFIAAVNSGGDQTLAFLFAGGVALGVLAAYVVYRWGGTHARKVRHQLRLEDHRARLEQYGRALRIWDQLEFCHRCQGVFLPGNEWQFEWELSGSVIAPHLAWWYASNLAEHLRGMEPGVVIVSGPQPAGGS